MKPLAVLLLFAASLPAAPIPKSLKKQRLNLDGVWEAQSVHVGLQPYAFQKEQPWTIHGDLLTFDWNNTAGKEYRLLLANSDQYRALDWIVTEGTTKRIYLGIDELDGDTWRFCVNMSPDNTKRPTKLEQHNDVYLYTFKRVK
jgi:uncharacterized protein (TIGR03067 family)